MGGAPGAAARLHAVLGWFCLLFPNHSEHRNERDVDEAEVPGSDAELELAESLDEGHALDVA